MENKPNSSRKRTRSALRHPVSISDEDIARFFEREEEISDGSATDSDFDVSSEDEETDESSEDDSGANGDCQASSDSGKRISPAGWQTERPVITPIAFTGNSGLKIRPHVLDPIGFFMLLANDEFFNHIISETNIYAQKLQNKSVADKSKMKPWKDLTRGEFEIFLGLLFHMGLIRINKIQYYWRKDGLYEFPTFSKAMPRDRFMIILRCLHFGRNAPDGHPKPSDPLYKIRPLLNLIQTNMKKVYYPQKQLSLDESMVLWRGRLYFRQYIKNKRHKYGIKLYMLTEPNGLVLNCLVYTGSKDPNVGGVGHSEKVVHSLLSDYTNVGHAVYMDNFYNSYKLSRELLGKKIYSTGTLRNTRKGNPHNVVNKKLAKGEVVGQYTKEGIFICKWKDRREVLMISSEHCGEMIEVANRRGKISKKPSVVAEYNKFMGGIDRADQIISYYPVERRSLRWYLKLGIHMFQILLNNSQILHNKFSSQHMSLQNFRESVIASLIFKNKPAEIPAPIQRKEKIHLPVQIQSEKGSRAQRKRCRNCSTTGVRRDVATYCPMCDGEPGLCLEPCFRVFHNY
ncbi:piggyBac transposable element-derived protein 4-like [Ischnura elegans]|uniref:piggyBac transposable element-derived protein 4-like n=1 Tax=Ischnura elegans TaxID=197161 RepID=UPI001ED8A88F|nr:piggyBac transposable element-derived protein 4-like [Ischnura elegans]